MKYLNILYVHIWAFGDLWSFKEQHFQNIFVIEKSAVLNAFDDIIWGPSQ